MKLSTQAEAWHAIWEGKTLVNGNGNIKVRLSGDGRARDIKTGEDFDLSIPEYWKVLEDSKTYCKFKKKDENSISMTSDYFLIDDIVYKTYIEHGWTPCKAKTFEEIK